MVYPQCTPNKADTYACEGCNEKFRLKSNFSKHLKICIDFQELKEKKCLKNIQ